MTDSNRLRVYYLIINGRRTSVQLTDGDARRRGLTVPGDAKVAEVDTNAAIGDVTDVDDTEVDVLTGIPADEVDAELSTGGTDEEEGDDVRTDTEREADEQANTERDKVADDKPAPARKGRRPANKARGAQNKAAD